MVPKKKSIPSQWKFSIFLKIKILKGNYDLEFPEEKLGQSQKPYVAGVGGGEICDLSRENLH